MLACHFPTVVLHCDAFSHWQVLVSAIHFIFRYRFAIFYRTYIAIGASIANNHYRRAAPVAIYYVLYTTYIEWRSRSTSVEKWLTGFGHHTRRTAHCTCPTPVTALPPHQRPPAFHRATSAAPGVKPAARARVSVACTAACWGSFRRPMIAWSSPCSSSRSTSASTAASGALSRVGPWCVADLHLTCTARIETWVVAMSVGGDGCHWIPSCWN